jgi:3-deoxy-D-manno-octulosonic acid (KDO) 8-phosphate synthase
MHEGSAVAEQVSVMAKQLLLDMFQIPGFLGRQFAMVAVGQERKERIEGCVEKEQQVTNHDELLVKSEKILT